MKSPSKHATAKTWQSQPTPASAAMQPHRRAPVSGPAAGDRRRRQTEASLAIRTDARSRIRPRHPRRCGPLASQIVLIERQGAKCEEFRAILSSAANLAHRTSEQFLQEANDLVDRAVAAGRLPEITADELLAMLPTEFFCDVFEPYLSSNTGGPWAPSDLN
jgi:hypothetical protein